MIIKLIENFYIETDPFNFILKEKYIGKDKDDNEKEQNRTIGFYPTLELALQALIRHKTLTNDETLTVEEYIKKNRGWTDELTRTIKRVAKEATE